MTTQLSTDSVPSTRSFVLDAEHGGIRFALPLFALAVFILVYIGINSIQSEQMQDYIGCLAFALATVSAVVVSFAADRLLKVIWPSPKRLLVDDVSVTYQNQRKPEENITLRFGERINPLAWRFVIKRGSARVQRGWEMLGVQLTQDETRLTLYTFMSPKQAAKLRLYSLFTPLASRATLDKGEIPLREAAAQKRLLSAEDERWRVGAELEHKQFEVLMELLAPHVSDWK